MVPFRRHQRLCFPRFQCILYLVSVDTAARRSLKCEVCVGLKGAAQGHRCCVLSVVEAGMCWWSPAAAEVRDLTTGGPVLGSVLAGRYLASPTTNTAQLYRVEGETYRVAGVDVWV